MGVGDARTPGESVGGYSPGDPPRTNDSSCTDYFRTGSTDARRGIANVNFASCSIREWFLPRHCRIGTSTLDSRSPSVAPLAEIDTRPAFWPASLPGPACRRDGTGAADWTRYCYLTSPVRVRLQLVNSVLDRYRHRYRLGSSDAVSMALITGTRVMKYPPTEEKGMANRRRARERFLWVVFQQVL